MMINESDGHFKKDSKMDKLMQFMIIDPGIHWSCASLASSIGMNDRTVRRKVTIMKKYDLVDTVNNMVFKITPDGMSRFYARLEN